MLGCNFPTDKMSYFKTDYCTSVGVTIHVECQGFLKERLENPDLKLTSTVCLFEANGAWNCNQHVETNKPIEFLSGKRSKLGNFTPATWKLHWQSKQTSWSWNCLDFFPIIMAEQNGSLQNKDTFLHKKRSCCTSIVGASKSISDFILKLKKSAERSKFMQTLDMHMQIYSLVGIYIYKYIQYMAYRPVSCSIFPTKKVSPPLGLPVSPYAVFGRGRPKQGLRQRTTRGRAAFGVESVYA